MSGTLYVVATPIGNLEDISFRALRVLREVSLIAAEDTRRTAKLLQHYSILTPTTSFHAHNEKRKQALLLNKLNNDQAIALVSDAGTPTISDPGALIVAAATEAGIRVEVIPGPSAVITAISASGLLTGTFTFVGFSPSRLKDRIPWLNELTSEERAIVFFESPHRIRTTLEQMQHIMNDRDIVIAREMTKVHEELVKGPISEVLKSLGSKVKGEITVVIQPKHLSSKKKSPPTTEQIWKEFRHLTEQLGLGKRASISRIAKSYDMKSRDIYSAIVRAKT